MLKGLTSTFKNNCNEKEVTYNEYIVIEGQTIPVRAKLTDDCYTNGNFIGNFIFKTIQFETSNDKKYRNKEFVYYNVVNGESIKIGTFITTEIEDNDTTEIVKVTGMDYGLKTQIEYRSNLDYSSGNVTLLDVWNELCELSGLESGVETFENADFIVDSDQFSGTGALIRDGFMGVALSSGSFIKVMNDDKIYPIFKTHTEDLLEKTINTQDTIENVQEIDKIEELQGNTYQQTYTGKNLCGIPDQTITINGVTITIKNGEITLNGTSTGATKYLLPIDTTTLNGNYTINLIYVSGSGSSSANFNIRKRSDNTLIQNTQTYFSNSNSYKQISVSEATSIEYGLYLPPSAKFTNYKFKIQIVSGTSSDYNYEPYVKNQPSPNPDYPQTIQNVTGRQTIDVVGKNLWGGISFTKNVNGLVLTTNTNGTITVDGTASANTTSATMAEINANKLYVTLKAGTYTVKGGKSDKRYLEIYDINNNFIAFNKTTGSTTFTLSEDKNVTIRVYIANGEVLNNETFEIMLEKGSTITTYEEYKGQSYEINLGKNLFKTLDTPSYLNLATYSKIDDNSFTLTYNQTSSSSSSPFARIDFDTTMFKPNTTYTVSKKQTISGISMSGVGTLRKYVNGSYGPVENADHITFTTPNVITSIGITLYLGYNNTTIGESTITFYDIQIEEGNTQSDFSPYFTPIELNKIGNYQDSIKKSTGKNLFDKDNITNGIFYDTTDGHIINTGVWTQSSFINATSGEQITIQSDYTTIDNSFLITQFDENQNWLRGQQFSLQTGKTTFTLGTNTKYIKIGYRNDRVNPNTLMLNEGSTALPYEPYGEGQWYIEKKIGKVVLDGTESYKFEVATNFGNTGKTRFTIYQIPTDYNSATAQIPAVFNIAINSPTTSYAQYNNAILMRYVSGQQTRLDLMSNTLNITTVADFKNWLGNNNLITYYQLNTPTYTEITNTDLINQLESIELLNGINNIMVSSGDLVGTIKLTYWNNNSELIEDYTELEDKRDTHPISCVRLGLSNVDGENVDIVDQDLVAKYGENWLIINDNPFAYNQSKREQLITAIFNKVKGFGYSAFVSKTSFKPYMTCGDTVKFKNKNGDLIDSILLRYSHEFKEDDMQIELQAPSETSATVNYVYPLTSVDISKKTQIEVDKDKVQIQNITEQTTLIQENLVQNYYTKEEANVLVQTAQTGLTNTFSEAGGNNIFRNTGLWFEQNDENNPYEFWNGKVARSSNEKASNKNALKLQNGALSQEQDVPNGNYTVSFKYKKLISLSVVKCYINDIEYELTETTDTEFQEVVEVNSKHINVRFVSDTNNSCEIYDLMVNAGSVKLAYSQNQNETTTDTVNISKGITITSSDQQNVVFKANADGVRIFEKSNMTTPKTKFTDKGTETNYLEAKDEAIIVDVLIQRVGNQTWFTKI